MATIILSSIICQMALSGVYIYLLLSPLPWHSVFPPYLARTSAGLGSFPAGFFFSVRMTHAFMPDMFVPFVNLPVLEC